MAEGLRVRIQGRLAAALQAKALREWRRQGDGVGQPVDIPVTLLRAEVRDDGAPDDLGWGLLCPRLVVLAIAGTHLGIVRQAALRPLVAAAIMRTAAAAEAAASGSATPAALSAGL